MFGLTLFPLLILAAAQADGAPVPVPELGIVRVAPDAWTFAAQPSGDRVIPFGANLIFNVPSGDLGLSLNVLTQPQWDPDSLRKAFEAARGLHFNIMKVFLPSHQILPDPQPADGAAIGAMQPPLLERLDYLFQVARETRIYVSLTFAEWGMHSLRWWQDGGVFLGRSRDSAPEANSWAVLSGFWKILAARYKAEPALFSYNFAVEYYMPGGNWGAQKSDDPKLAHLITDRWGLPAWRASLRETFGSVDVVNQRWGTRYASWEDIPQPEFDWADGKYSQPSALLADYNDFRERVNYAFLKMQADAVRSEDTVHMLTCGLHPHHPAVGWMSSAKYLAAVAPFELDFLDYITVHVYTNSPDMKPGLQPRMLHQAMLETRFAYAGKPVVVEEMGHITNDRADVTKHTLLLLEKLRPSASGFMLWYLTDSNAHTPSGPLNCDFSVNAFGEAWRALAEPGGLVAQTPAKRAAAVEVIRLKREDALAPDRPTPTQQVLDAWDDARQPVDIVLPPNPLIQRLRSAAK